jgi:hypothetical protein
MCCVDIPWVCQDMVRPTLCQQCCQVLCCQVPSAFIVFALLPQRLRAVLCHTHAAAVSSRQVVVMHMRQGFCCAASHLPLRYCYRC